MITHIVQWKVKDACDGMEKNGILAEMKERLEALPETVAEIISLQVGLNEKPSDAASDIVLLSTFADWEALQRYQIHPEHQKVAGFIKSVVTDRSVVDFSS